MVFCMMVAATASADLSSKIYLLLRCLIGSLAERFCFLRCFSFSSYAISLVCWSKFLFFRIEMVWMFFEVQLLEKEARQLEKYMD